MRQLRAGIKRQQKAEALDAPVITYYDAFGEILAQTVIFTLSDIPGAPEGTASLGMSKREWFEPQTKEPLPPGEKLLMAMLEGRWLKVEHPASVLRARASRS